MVVFGQIKPSITERDSYNLAKRMSKLMKWYLAGNIMALFYGINKNRYSFSHIGKYLYDIFIKIEPLDGIESVWFLYVLGIIEILYVMVNKATNDKNRNLVITGIAFVGIIINHMYMHENILFRFDTILIAFPIYAGGVKFKTFLKAHVTVCKGMIMNYIKNKSVVISWGVLGTSMILSFFHYVLYDSYISLDGGVYNNYILFYVNVFLGCYFIYLISCRICEAEIKSKYLTTAVRFVEKIGKDSLHFVCFHAFVIIAVRKIINCLKPSGYSSRVLIWDMIVMFLTVLGTFCISYLINIVKEIIFERCSCSGN